MLESREPSTSRHYPQPTITQGDGYRDYETHIGWPGKPYGVEIHSFNPIYISVKPKKGYRELGAGRRGFIYTTENPARVDRLVRKCLRIAWRLNHNPKYAADTKTIVTVSMAKLGGIR